MGVGGGALVATEPFRMGLVVVEGLILQMRKKMCQVDLSTGLDISPYWNRHGRSEDAVRSLGPD